MQFFYESMKKCFSGDGGGKKFRDKESMVFYFRGCYRSFIFQKKIWKVKTCFTVKKSFTFGAAHFMWKRVFDGRVKTRVSMERGKGCPKP